MLNRIHSNVLYLKSYSFGETNLFAHIKKWKVHDRNPDRNIKTTKKDYIHILLQCLIMTLVPLIAFLYMSAKNIIL